MEHVVPAFLGKDSPKFPQFPDTYRTFATTKDVLDLLIIGLISTALLDSAT